MYDKFHTISIIQEESKSGETPGLHSSNVNLTQNKLSSNSSCFKKINYGEELDNSKEDSF